MMRIDTHAHVFFRSASMADQRRYTPEYDATVQDYLHELRSNDLTHGILVQPSFLGTDNSLLLETLEESGGQLRGIAVVDATFRREDIVRLKDAGVVGVRLNLVGRKIPNVNLPEWAELMEGLVASGLFVEVYGRSTILALVVPNLLRRGAKVIVDHFGMPDPEIGVLDPHFDSLLDYGTSRRLWCKLSAPYRCGPNGEAIALEAYPLLREALGLDRLLWGSDWPHTQHEGHQTYQASRAFFDHLVPDAAENRQILNNMAELFDH